MVSTLPRPYFSDEIIKATALNRTSGAILDKASRNPVTIIRNDECFALLNRDLFAELVAEATQSGKVLDVIHAAFQTLSGNPPAIESSYGWLSAFDNDEIQDLVTEVLGAFRSAPFVEDGWEELETTIQEWHESSIAILSDDLDSAFSDKSNEVLLSAPSAWPTA